MQQKNFDKQNISGLKQLNLILYNKDNSCKRVKRGLINRLELIIRI